MNGTSAECETAFSLTFHPVYRASQIYNFLILILAIAPLVYFIFWKMIFSAFHGNLKCVIIGYFGSVLVFTAYFGWFSSYHVFIPYFVSEKCNLLIEKSLFKYGHLTAVVFLSTPMLFPLAISIERFYATMQAAHYEQKRVILGPVVTVLTILIDVCIILFIYRNETFDIGSINFSFIPSATSKAMFTFYWILFFFNIFNFLVNIALLRENRRIKKLNNSSLAVRYQLEEVYLSTKFAVSVIFVHVIFFGCYVLTVILVRYYGGNFISDPLTLTAARGVSICMVATYNFTISIVAVCLYKSIQSKKQINIRGNVQLKATGKDGAQNYDNAIFSVWNSLSSTSDRARV